MVSFTLKVILHVAENDSKYHDVAPLIIERGAFNLKIDFVQTYEKKNLMLIKNSQHYYVFEWLFV